MLNLDDDRRTEILLKQEDHAVDQLRAIKDEEMSWLKVFLLFYAAIIAWGVARWLTGPLAQMPATARSNPNDERYIVYSTIVLAFLATTIFGYHFIRQRWSYYDVADRLVSLQRLLRLYDKKEWGDSPMGSGSTHTRLEEIKGVRDWCRGTKPLSSFLTRIVYLAGAFVTVAFVCWCGLQRMTPTASAWFFAACLIGCVTLVGFLYFFDLVHFLVAHKK